MVAATEHLAHLGMAKLRFAVNLDSSARWVGNKLSESGLFKLTFFVKSEAHREKHQNKDDDYDGKTHK